MKPKHQRLLFIVFSVGFLMLSILFIMRAFDENLIYFYSPSDVKEKTPLATQKIRIGGLVEPGSIQKKENQQIFFNITDGANRVQVAYTGMLPSLFREGQGVVAEGKLDASGLFTASTILAKHDENYMPKEVVDALKKSGRWQEEGAQDAR